MFFLSVDSRYSVSVVYDLGVWAHFGPKKLHKKNQQDS